MKVVILYGGESNERAVSINTATNMKDELESAIQRSGRGITVTLLDVVDGFVPQLITLAPHYAIIAVHGYKGEDGRLQSLLELLNIPYYGSGVESSAVTMDKLFFKNIMDANNITTPKYITAYEPLSSIPLIFKGKSNTDAKCVVKVPRSGSSIGVYISDASSILEDTTKALQQARSEVRNSAGGILIEECIEGVECTVPVLDGKAYTPILITPPPNSFYDYDAKYEYKHGRTDYIVADNLTDDLKGALQAVSEQIFTLCGCSGIARVDFILQNTTLEDVFTATSETVALHVLELNTIPGMTENSLVPKTLQHNNISLGEILLQTIPNMN